MPDHSYELPAETGCIAYDYDRYGPTIYGYIPSLAAGIVFVICFALISVAHTWQAIRTRYWWQFTFVAAGLGELIGWIGRLLSSQCPYDATPFLMQISTLIFSPAFTAAGCYIILGVIIRAYGRDISPISPALYIWIFCSVDVISLIMQAVGGGLASAASDQVPQGDLQPPTDLMVAGIIFQLISLCVFAVMFALTLRKGRIFSRPHGTDASQARANHYTRILSLATAFSVLLMISRGIYRSIELIQGWEGFLITHEAYFDVLDATQMVLALAVFNFINPGSIVPKIAKSGETISASGRITNSDDEGAISAEKSKQANGDSD